MVVYVDIILIENLIIDYIILFTTAIVIKKDIKYIRIFIASFIGSIYSLVSYSQIIEMQFSLIIKIAISALMVWISFNPQTIKKMLKYITLFYLISFSFGGAALAFIYIVKPQDIIMKNGSFVGIYQLHSIVIACIVTFFIVVISFSIARKRITKKDIYYDIEIKLNKKLIKTKAIVDTGNMLKDPINNMPVVILEHTLLYECIPKEILNNLENILGGDFKGIPNDIKERYISKLRFIPFESVGKQNGMLIGLKSEYINIINKEDKKNIRNAIIGIYNKTLTRKGEYKALIGLELI